MDRTKKILKQVDGLTYSQAMYQLANAIRAFAESSDNKSVLLTTATVLQVIVNKLIEKSNEPHIYD